MYHKIKTAIALYFNISSVFSLLLALASNHWKRVHCQGIHFYVHSPNPLCRYRAASFLYKEPETIEWIDTFSPGDTLWDIGANIGLFSIYAAKRCVNVVAFEPMIENLLELKANTIKNKLNQYISIVPLGLSDSSSTLWLTCPDFTIGRAFNSLETHSSLPTSYKTISINAEALSTLEQPTHIKIDVDGNELSVVHSLTTVLKHVKSLCIELNFDDDSCISSVSEYMKSQGFSMYDRRRSPSLDWSNDMTYNTFWSR